MAASGVKIMCTCQAILDAFVLASKKMATSVAAPGLMTKERLWRFVLSKCFTVSGSFLLLLLSCFCAKIIVYNLKELPSFCCAIFVL